RGNLRTLGLFWPELGLLVAHPDGGWPGRVALQCDGYGADAFLEVDLASTRRQAARGGQYPGRAHRRMAGEGELAGWREDAHFGGAVISGGRDDEGGLGQVHLQRDLLHLFVGQTGRLEEHRQRVTAKDAIGKDVDLGEGVGA